MAALERAEASADAQLAKMGYKAELPRNLSMMSILGLYVFRVTFYSAEPSAELTGLPVQVFRDYGFVHVLFLRILLAYDGG